VWWLPLLFPLPLLHAVLAGVSMQNQDVLHGTVLLLGLTLAARSNDL
jgi:hypothetical protein